MKRKLKPRINSIVLTPDHVDAKKIRVYFGDEEVHCTAVELLTKDGKYWFK